LYILNGTCKNNPQKVASVGASKVLSSRADIIYLKYILYYTYYYSGNFAGELYLKYYYFYCIQYLLVVELPRGINIKVYTITMNVDIIYRS